MLSAIPDLAGQHPLHKRHLQSVHSLLGWGYAVLVELV